jgi:hypothetical protein
MNFHLSDFKDIKVVVIMNVLLGSGHQVTRFEEHEFDCHFDGHMEWKDAIVRRDIGDGIT